MKNLKHFIPILQGSLIGAGVGFATNNIAVGLVLTVIFSFFFKIKPTKC